MILAAEFVTRPEPPRAPSLPGLPLEANAVLTALQFADGASIRGLARRAGLTPHRVADALSALADAGLAEREDGAVWLTPAGRATGSGPLPVLGTC